MKKIYKKLLTIICAVTLCIVCTGCSWLEINKKSYYNQVVASIGKIEFTKQDLTEAYQSYGYQYMEQGYYSSMEDAINATIDSMIERRLLLDEVKKYYSISTPESLEIRKEAYDYIQESVDSYAEKVRKEWDCEIKFEEDAEEEPLRDAETEYTPSTEYTVVTKIVNNKEVNEIVVSRIDEPKASVDTSDLPEHFTKSYLRVTDEKVYAEAWTRYIKGLQDAAKSEDRSTKEEDVLLHEEKRLIRLLENNKYLEKFQDDFFENTPVDVQTVLKYYREKYAEQKSQYNTPEDHYSAYHEAMKESSKNYIYYHPDSGNQYVNVKHILLNFDDRQKEAVEALKVEFDVKDADGKEDNTIIESDAYQARLKEIAGRTTTTFEMDGKTYTWTANEVINYVEGEVKSLGNFTEKSSRFDDLIYIFNDDPGIMNSEFDYVVNLDTENVTDQMVKPFADGVRSLDESNGGEGRGSMKAIISDYGIHIIFHDGNATNLFGDTDLSDIGDEQLLLALCSTMTTPDSNKSIFNYIYDTLAIDDNLYNMKSTTVINSIKTALAKEDIKIIYYKNNYKDLYE